MKIVRLSEIENTQRDVLFTGGNSQRFVLEKDNVGFAMMKTNVKKGGPYHWHYKHHLEACFCVSGIGVLRNLESGKKYTIGPDVVYILDKNDNHTFEAITDVVLISVFNPPLTGGESHGSDGCYPPSQSKKDKVNMIIDIVNKTKNDYDLYDKLTKAL